MKRVLRSFAVGLLVGGLVGLWSGMNIGKGRPLLANPFGDVAVAQQAQQAGERVGETARAAGERAQHAVQ